MYVAGECLSEDICDPLTTFFDITYICEYVLGGKFFKYISLS